MARQEERDDEEIDEARREQLRRDPTVIVHRPERRVPFTATLRVVGVTDVRALLDRDDDADDSEKRRLLPRTRSSRQTST